MEKAVRVSLRQELEECQPFSTVSAVVLGPRKTGSPWGNSAFSPLPF